MDWIKKIGVADPKLLVVCILLALTQGAIFVGAQASYTGALSFPLDDSYIHLQYAKQIARGEYFRYQDGDPVSTGATSVLYVHLLALGYLIGFRGELFPIWALFLAWISVSLTFYQVIQLGRRWNSNFAGWAALLLIFFSGILAWGFWSGMEIALFSVCLLTVFRYLDCSRNLQPFIFILLGFLTLCRPEGTIISVILALGFLTRFCMKRSWASHRFPPRLWASILFYILTLILPILFFRLATGQWGGNGLFAKSLLNHPIMSGFEIVQEFLKNLLSMAAFLLGGGQGELGEFVLPGTLFFVVVGIIGVVQRCDKELAWENFCAGGALLLVLIALATLEVWPMHNYRYLLPFFPLFYLFGVIGTEYTLDWLRLHGAAIRPVLIVFAVLISGLYYPVWAGRYVENSTTIYEKQRRTAVWISTQWLSKHFLPSSSIAINDAGALVYYSKPQDAGQRMIDLVGLVTNGAANVYRMGEGGLYEWLERLPVEQRPRYSAIFPSWFKEMSRVYDIFYKPIASFPDPFDPEFEKTIFEVNWNYAGVEDEPRRNSLWPGWTVRDRLDVGDLVSEREHEYHFLNRDRRFPKIPVPFRRNFGYHDEVEARWPDVKNEQTDLIPALKRDGTIYQYDIVDVGRRITGEESFRLGGLIPHRNAYLIVRTCDGSGDFPEFQYSLNVYIEDLFLQTCTFKGTPWNWYEFVIKIPADLVLSSNVNIRIINQGSTKFSYYDSFYYWIVQPE